MPPGGAGLYFFYINFPIDIQEFTVFVVRVSGVELCVASNDENSSGVNVLYCYMICTVFSSELSGI